MLVGSRRASAAEDIYYYKPSTRQKEVDFVVCRQNIVLELIQVAYDISDSKTYRRETEALVNAAEHYDKDKKQNTLSEEHIGKIVDTYRFRKDDDRYSRCVSIREIVENDYNLNITRYVSLAQEEAQIDLSANQEKLSEIERTLADARAKFNGYLRELGLKEI